MDIEILEKTKDYLVVNKPAGLLVHCAEHNKDEESLVDVLLEKCPEIKGVGDDDMRPGIVHRLDKSVGGLLVVAKTQKMFEFLKKQFQDRSVRKEYLALVYGVTSKDYDKIDFPIERSSKGFKMAAKPMGTEIGGRVREAITEFQVEQRFVNYTFIRVKIKTGRTHQIRCHMTAYGHPIVGDDLYSTAKTRIKNKKLSLGGVFLNAVRLGFVDLDGESKSYEIELSSGLKDVLKAVK